MLSGGHLLIEDIPGTGKTILAKSLASVLNLDFKRVQFTSDLMPSDVLGVSIFNPNTRSFELHKGPIFTNILLADEINRAPQRSQSSLLEAMAEKQVSIENSTHLLSDLFFVIATQNPVDMKGTFPLPNAQKDRFLFQLSMGYPDKKSEIALMMGERRDTLLKKKNDHFLNIDHLIILKEMVNKITVSPKIYEYAYSLIDATRNHENIACGLSTRASLDLIKSSKAHAMVMGRNFVNPEDVQEVFLHMAPHRISSTQNESNHVEIIKKIISATRV